MRKLWFFLFLFISFNQALSLEDTKKVLLVPFEASESSQPTELSSTVRDMLCASFYNYLSIFTFLEIPEQQELKKLKVNEKNLLKTARQENADFIVYGSYQISGDSSIPDILIQVKIWSLSKKAIIMDKVLHSKFDLDIFDTIDEMAAQTLILAFQVKSGFAVLDFSHLKTGTGVYDLYINNRKKTTLSNENHNFQQKILGDTSYKVVLKHRHKEVVYKKRIKVASGEVSNIMYHALGNIYIEAISQKKLGLKYELSLDHQPVEQRNYYSSLDAGKTHILEVLTNSIPITEQSFYLTDGEYLKVTPVAGHINKWYLSLGLKIRTGYIQITNTNSNEELFKKETALGLSLQSEYYLTPRLLLGAGISFFKYDKEDQTNVSIILWSFPLDLKFQIIGDNTKDFRVFAGLFGDIQLFYLKNKFDAQYLNHSSIIPKLDGGILLEAQLTSGFFLKTQIYFAADRQHDLSSLGFPGLMINPEESHLTILAAYKIGF